MDGIMSQKHRADPKLGHCPAQQCYFLHQQNGRFVPDAKNEFLPMQPKRITIKERMLDEKQGYLQAHPMRSFVCLIANCWFLCPVHKRPSRSMIPSHFRR